MQQTALEKRIITAITPTAESMGYDVVRVLITGTGTPTLQIFAERADGTMGVEDCSRLSQAVSAVIDVENIMSDSAYFLEVSSPGIDRPLTRLKDFVDYNGFEARIELDAPLDGQKKFKGRLKGTEGDTIAIETDTGNVSIPFPLILKAKLLLTDDLISAAQSRKNATQ